MKQDKMHLVNKIFNNEIIRTVWDKDEEKYYISVVDIVSIISESKDGRKYWNKLKQRLNDEGNETVTNCHQLKLKAQDGKYRLTDVVDIGGMFRIIESIPSKNAEPIKMWLAKLGSERIDEIFDPSITVERAKLESILYQGGYKDYNPSGQIGRNNPNIDIQRRIELAYLLLNNPETFDTIVNNNIIYFHGTNATALPSIMEHGILSGKALEGQNVDITTGERWTRTDGNRGFISFTDVLRVAEDYSKISPDQNSDLSYPIVFGTTKENILNSGYINIYSNVPEVGVRNNFNKESISCILVPSDKIETTKKIVGNEIPVLPIDDIESRFYWYDPEGYYIIMDEEKYNDFQNKMADTATASQDDSLSSFKGPFRGGR